VEQAFRCGAGFAGALLDGIGYALAPCDAAQAMDLLRLADGAMYAAKRAGKSRVVHCLDAP
jgi:GGDEF domain-containing protein